MASALPPEPPPTPSGATPPGYDRILSHLGGIVGISCVIGLLVAGLAIPVVAIVNYSSTAAEKTLDELPVALDALPLPQRTKVLNANGDVIATFYDQNRVNVSLRKVSPIMREAILAIEDYRFYDHGALDLKGTLRAFVSNQASGNASQGGSSITQQLAKMTAVAQARTPSERVKATEDTYERKMRELRHAISFEQNHSKDWILERYLNTAYFGEGAYGIESAAQHYFSVSAKQLKLKQAATLAGLVKNPNGYSPVKYPERAKARRNVVLARMGSLDMIDQQKAAKLQAKGLGLKVSPDGNGCLAAERAAFYCDFVRKYLLADPTLGETVQAREQLLDQGGLTIQTSLRPAFQKAAVDAAKSDVQPTEQRIGSVAMVEPGTGKVLGIGQSRPMGRDDEQGETFLNFSVNSKYGDAAGFQPGSTFKLFVIAAGLEQGMSPYTAINSPSTVSLDKHDFRICDEQPYPDYGAWAPSNSTSSGIMDFYTGTRLSVNTFFAQLELRTGLCQPYELAKAMGVELTDPDREMVPSFTLGVADVSPLEMAGAYATFAARGMYCEPRPVLEIRNPDDSLFKEYPQKCEQVIAEDTADRINDILDGVIAPGGFGSRLTLTRPAAGKTGTTQSARAVWFVGYTTSVSTASVIAGADSEGRPISLGAASGSGVAGPQWAYAMRAVQDLMPYEDFSTPIGGGYVPRDYRPKKPEPPRRAGQNNRRNNGQPNRPRRGNQNGPRN